MSIIATTKRAYIREFSANEENLLLELYADERVMEFEDKITAEQTRQKFKEILLAYPAQRGFGRWGIFSKTEDQFIGLCKLMRATWDNQRIEVSYILTNKYWGQGLGTEIVKAVIEYGFKEMQLKEIHARVNPKNTASENIAVKIGFKKNNENDWQEGDLNYFQIKNSV